MSTYTVHALDNLENVLNEETDLEFADLEAACWRALQFPGYTHGQWWWDDTETRIGLQPPPDFQLGYAPDYEGPLRPSE